MPPVEAPQPAQDVQNESDGISKPMVGIIYPPPEVRSILLCNFRKYIINLHTLHYLHDDDDYDDDDTYMC